MKKTKKKGIDALMVVFETQQEIANVCGISQASVSRWVNVPRKRIQPLIDAGVLLGWELNRDQLRIKR